MRTKTVLRHFCDHCGKSRARRDAMEAHELKCFRNPSRKCPVCGAVGTNAEAKAIMGEFLGGTHDQAEDIKKLSESLDDCPWCVLAAMTIFNIQSEDEDKVGFQFDFAAARKAWQDEQSEEFADVVGLHPGYYD